MQGILPPGLAGYVLAQQQGQHNSMNQLQQMGGLLQMQNALMAQQEAQETRPLQRALLEAKVRQAKQDEAVLAQYMAARGMGGAPQPAPMAFSEGGMSTPGGGQANVMTGQAIPAGAIPQRVGPGGLPPHIELGMLNSRTAPLAKLEAEMYKPTDKMREAVALGFQPGTPAFNFYVGTQFNQGGAWQFGPDGQLRLAPSYAEGQGAIRGAEERARAGYDLVDVPVAGGGSRRMSRLDALNLLGSSGASQPQPRGLPQQPPVAPVGPLAQQGALRGAIGNVPPEVPTQRDVSQIDAELSNPRLPAQARTALQAERARVTGALGVTQTDADKTYSGERAKFYADRAGKLNESWYSANESNSKLDLLQSLFANPAVASGALAESISDLKGLADSLGIQTQGKGAEDVVRAITTEMALKARNSGGVNLLPGAMSDYESKLLKSMQPALSQSREGRALMVEVSRAKILQDMKVSELAAAYEERTGKLDAGFEREARTYLRQNPMFDERRAAAMLELAKRLSAGPKK